MMNTFKAFIVALQASRSLAALTEEAPNSIEPRLLADVLHAITDKCTTTGDHAACSEFATTELAKCSPDDHYCQKTKVINIHAFCQGVCDTSNYVPSAVRSFLELTGTGTNKNPKDLNNEWYADEETMRELKDLTLSMPVKNIFEMEKRATSIAVRTDESTQDNKSDDIIAGKLLSSVKASDLIEGLALKQLFDDGGNPFERQLKEEIAKLRQKFDGARDTTAKEESSNKDPLRRESRRSIGGIGSSLKHHLRDPQTGRYLELPRGYGYSNSELYYDNGYYDDSGNDADLYSDEVPAEQREEWPDSQAITTGSNREHTGNIESLPRTQTGKTYAGNDDPAVAMGPIVLYKETPVTTINQPHQTDTAGTTSASKNFAERIKYALNIHAGVNSNATSQGMKSSARAKNPANRSAIQKENTSAPTGPRNDADGLAVRLTTLGFVLGLLIAMIM